MEKKISQISYLPLACSLIGFSLCLFRFLYTMFAFPVLQDEGSGIEFYMWLLMVLASSIIQILAILYVSQKKYLFNHFAVMLGLTIVASVGMILIYVGFSEESHGLLGYIGAIMASFGAAALPLLWRETSGLIPTLGVQRLFIFGSVILASILYLLCLSLPTPLAIVINSAAPIASILFLRKAFLDPGQAKHRLHANIREKMKEKTSFKQNVFFYVFCFAFGMPQSVIKSNFFSFSSSADASWTLMVAGAIVIVGAFAVIDRLLFKKVSGSFATRIFLPVITIFVMVLPFFTYGNLAITNIAVFAGLLLFWVCFYSELDKASSREFINVRLFAGGILSGNIGMVLSTVTGNALEGLITLQVMGLFLGSICFSAWAFKERFQNSSLQRFTLEGAEDGLEELESFEPANIRDSIHHQSEQVAKKYALSPREQEVLEYLVRGRTAKSISDELFVSYNTVKTHMSRIYYKMDVHTREELIRLVESVE